MTTPMPTEAECERTIIMSAQLAGWMVHGERTSRTASGGFSTAVKGTPGFPDLCLCRGGQLLFVELKRDKGSKIQPHQQEWIDALDQVSGVRAMIVYVPSDMPRLILALQRRA